MPYGYRYSKPLFAGLAFLLLLGIGLHVKLTVGAPVTARDFPVFYWAGLCARSGDMSRLYNVAARTAFCVEQIGASCRDVAYIYPPAYAYLFAPFAAFPLEVAHKIWLFSQLAFLLGILHILVRRVLSADAATELLLLTFALYTDGVVSNQLYAQTNVVVLGGCVLISVGSLRSSNLAKGLFWAVVSLLKPITGTLITVFWRTPKALAAALLFGAAVLFMPGWEPLLSFVNWYPRYVVDNVSSPNRLFSLYQIAAALDAAHVATYLVLLLLGLVITALAVSLLDGWPDKVAVAIAASCAFSPSLEPHHLVLMLIPSCAMFVKSQRDNIWWARSATWLIMLCMLFPGSLVEVSWERYIPFVGAMLLWGAWVSVASNSQRVEPRGKVSCTSVRT